MLAWMAWTWFTAAFFGVIAICLITLTVLAVRFPEAPRRGILRFPTTRGDRFFISLLAAAYLHILWLRLDGGPLWYPLGASIVLAICIFRWV